MEVRARENEGSDEEDVTNSPSLTQEGSEEDTESEQGVGMDVSPGMTSDEATRDMDEFEWQELDHDVAFSHQRRLSCFNHTLQLVVWIFDMV